MALKEKSMRELLLGVKDNITTCSCDFVKSSQLF